LAASAAVFLTISSALHLGAAPAPASSTAIPVVARQNGMCLGVSEAFTGLGAPVILSTCQGADIQQWTIEIAATGYAQLVNGRTGMCLSVSGASLNDGARAILWTCVSDASQQWRIEPGTGGFAHLVARHSSQCLSVGGSGSAGTSVVQRICDGSSSQDWQTSGLPSSGTADIVRFLEQATFGPTRELIAHVRAVGFQAFLDEQFAVPASSYPTLPLYPTTRDTTTCPNGSTCQRDNYTMYPLQNRFFVNALYGPDQLRQRVAFALHQIIVVSGVDVTQPSWMAPYLQTLDRDAFGSFRQLLFDISVNPAMGNYLDIVNNVKANPNENYGREILQLFSIGTVRLNPDGTTALDEIGQPVPTYTQTTINNFARVFTGWRFATAPATGVPNYIDPMVANNAQHDVGAKTLLNGVVLSANRTTVQDLNDALDNIVNDPNVAPFISKQLIQHLITSNPSPAYVARVASVFTADATGARGNLQAVVRAILLDPEARGDAKTDPNYGRLRHPAEYIAGLLRTFDAKSADGMSLSDGYLNPQAVNMGMDVFRPPSVFSYFSPSATIAGTAGVRGPEFGLYTTSTALRRANFVNTMVFSTIPTGVNAPTGTALDLSPLTALAGNPDALLDDLNQLLLHGTMSTAMRDTIRQAVIAVPASNALKRARTAVYLVATSSQYQVER